MGDELSFSLNVKFNKGLYTIENLLKTNSVSDLKQAIYALTKVPPKNQKLIGLVAEKGSVFSDSLLLQYLIVKPSTKIMLIGSTEEEVEKVKAVNANAAESIDDFDLLEDDLELHEKPENVAKINKRCASYKFTQIAETRPGKRLLVLDIDYTIFDHLTPAESAMHLMRPYLNEMLTRAYVNYDIAIWSATSMTWILAKIGQMNLIPQGTDTLVRQQQVNQSPTSAASDLSIETSILPVNFAPDAPYRICLLVDSGAMISVYLENRGVKEVKPLQVIWNKYPQYGPHNTIMFDDVRRNFVMNPQSGLRIHSYRDAHLNHSSDKELAHLADYLDLIAMNESDFTKLNHNKWTSYLEKHKRHLEQKKRPATTIGSVVATTTPIPSPVYETAGPEDAGIAPQSKKRPPPISHECESPDNSSNPPID